MVDISYTQNEIIITLYPEDLKPDVVKMLIDKGIIDENASVFGIVTIHVEKNV